MNIGTRVEVNKDNAKTWGYEIPAVGVITGEDPEGRNPKIVQVKLDQGHSIYEVKGVHIFRLKTI